MRYLRKFNSSTAVQGYLDKIVIPDIPYVHYVSSTNEVLYSGDGEWNDNSKYPLYIKATQDGTIKFSNPCEYSTDNETWISADSSTSIPVSNEQTVFLRASSLSSTSNVGRFTSTCYYNVGGNVMSMIYGEDFIGKTDLPRDSVLGYLFKDSVGLLDASNLVLPATTLTAKCYQYMFAGCSSLKRAPLLPATTLANYCYSHMFDSCRALVEASDLPATTLSGYCYSTMFYSCYSLVKAPKISATSCSTGCFWHMFTYCKSLVEAPELPSTSLATFCYSHMFRECESLVKAPSLPATQAATECYKNMFEGCTSLVDPPEILLVNTSNNCCQEMFSGCTSLATTPELHVQTLSNECFASMFMGCTALTSPPKLLSPTTSAPGCYSGMISGTNMLPDCSNIDFTDSEVVNRGVLRGFFAGTKVTDEDLSILLPKDENGNYCLPVTELSSHCYSSMFSGCKQLVTAPELPATTLAYSCYSYMFNGCTSLINAPELPATTLASACYNGMFYLCRSLATAPELPATTLASSCYDSMFWGCTNLTTAPELPATTLADYCYQCMLRECEALTTAPELPATILADRCYEYMFVSSRSINYIKMLATDISASACLYSWAQYVASTGTFVKNVNATWDVTGVNGVPSGWTVRFFDPDTDKYVIKFTIGGTSYIAEEGVTWADWVASSYNTAGFTVSDTSILSAGGVTVVLSDVAVVSTDAITSDGAYTLQPETTESESETETTTE